LIDRRTLPLFVRQALLAVASACALASPALAQTPQSRDYPPTYSSRKAPWYDPFGVFTSSDKKPATDKRPITQVQSVATPIQSVAPPAAPAPVVTQGPVTTAGPSWKWYGYGTPAPGQNANYAGTWYQSTGATPGTVPPGRTGPVLVPDPAPTFAGQRQPRTATPVVPPNGPSLPKQSTPASGPLPNVNGQSAPARLGPPANPTSTADDGRPRATLKAPVPVDDAAETPPKLPTAIPPTQPPESPDLPVVPAPDIVPPATGGTVSMAVTRVTARALAPDDELPASLVAAIRQACEPDVRVMEVAQLGPKRIVVRMSATPEAALAARNRLAKSPDRAGWRVEFEMVTPLGR
jgi:hypothetical protein